MTPVEVRRGLVEALKLDLVGPENGSGIPEGIPDTHAFVTVRRTHSFPLARPEGSQTPMLLGIPDTHAFVTVRRTHSFPLARPAQNHGRWSFQTRPR